MEQELTDMLELLRQGLSELPAIGSDVYNIYVRGIKIEGGVQIATYVTVILIVTCLIRHFKKKLDNHWCGGMFWGLHRANETVCT